MIQWQLAAESAEELAAWVALVEDKIREARADDVEQAKIEDVSASFGRRCWLLLLLVCFSAISLVVC